MQPQGFDRRSAVGALILLLALNVLAWAIIAYTGSKHDGDALTWAHERTYLLDEKASFETELVAANEQRASESETAAALAGSLEKSEARIADLEARLDAQAAASADLASYRDKINLARSELSGKTATLAAREREIAKAAEQSSLLEQIGDLRAAFDAEQSAFDEQKARAEAQLDAYQQRINQARSEMSGKTATLAARDRAIVKAAERLSLLDQVDDLQSAFQAEQQDVERRRAQADAELRDYQERINLAKSSLSGRTATLAAREREIVKADDRLAALPRDIDQAETEFDVLSSALMERDEVEGALIALRNEQATKLAVLGSLAGKIDRQRDDMDKASKALQSEFEMKEGELKQRQAELAGADERLGVLNGEIERSKAHLASLQQEIKTREGDLGEVQTVLAGLYQARDDEKSAAADLEARQQELETLSASLAAREGDIAAANERLGEIEVNLSQVEATLQQRNNAVAAIDQEIKAGEERLVELGEEAREQQQRADEASARLVADDKEIALRQKEVTKLKRDEEKVRIMLTGLQARLAEQRLIRIDLDGLRSETETAHAEAETASNERDEHVQRLAAERKLLREIEAERGRAETALKSAEDRLQITEARLGDISKAETKLTTLTSSISAREADLRAKETAVERVEARLASLEEKAERVLSQHDSEEKKLLETSTALDARRGDLKRLEAALADAESRVEAAASADREQVAALTKADDELKALQAEVAELRRDETEKSARLAEIDTELSEAGERLQGLKAEKGTLEAQVADLAQTVDQSKAASASASQEASSLQEAMGKAAAGLEAIRAERQQAIEAAQQAEAALETARDAKAGVISETDSLKASLAALSVDIEAKRAEKDEVAASVESVLVDLEKADADLLTRRAELATSQDELERLVMERRRLRDTIDKARNDVSVATLAGGFDPLLTAMPVQTENGVRIAHLLFNYSSAELSPGAQRKVDDAAAWIKGNEVRKVRLIGYADSTGSSADNKALSEARAQQTAKALADFGVDPAIIDIEAVGDDVLIEATGKSVAEPLNRSVGIFVGESRAGAKCLRA